MLYFSSVFLVEFGVLDLSYFFAAWNEVNTLGFSSNGLSPLVDIFNLGHLFYNLILYFFSLFLSGSYLYIVYGIFLYSSIFIILSKLNRLGLVLFFIIYLSFNFYYSFFVSVPGTALRMILFSLLVFLVFTMFNFSKVIKKV
jgi:hypothetical protein